jgi:predicted aspartyl protease
MRLGFKGGGTKLLQLDLGFNGGLLLPSKDFRQLTRGSLHIDTQMKQFSTPGSTNELKTSIVSDTVYIGKVPFATVVCANELASERLIGLGFFQHFEWLILDYKARRVYGRLTSRLD